MNVILTLKGYCVICDKQIDGSTLKKYYIEKLNINCYKYQYNLKVNKHTYLFPRNTPFTKYINKLSRCECKINIIQYSLKCYQSVIFNELIKILDSKSYCYFKLDTGLGKTYILGKVIDRLQLNTLIIGPNKNAKLTWDKIFDNGISPFYTINSIIKLIDSGTINTFISNYSLLILDEVHNYCTISRLRIFESCNVLYMIGCTATPIRPDEMHLCLPYYLGPLYDFNKYANVEYSTNVNVIKYNSRDILAYNGNFDIHQIYKSLETDDKRNSIICKIVSDSIELTSSNIFIFTEHIQHIDILWELLNKRIVYDEYTKYTLIKYNNKNNKLEIDPNNIHVILTTYKMASESLSLSNTYTLIFGTPRKNNIPQILGRIFRGNELNQTRYIYDIVDSGYGFFSRQFKVRKEIYIDKKCNIINLTI